MASSSGLTHPCLCVASFFAIRYSCDKITTVALSLPVIGSVPFCFLVLKDRPPPPPASISREDCLPVSQCSEGRLVLLFCPGRGGTISSVRSLCFGRAAQQSCHNWKPYHSCFDAFWCFGFVGASCLLNHPTVCTCSGLDPACCSQRDSANALPHPERVVQVVRRVRRKGPQQRRLLHWDSAQGFGPKRGEFSPFCTSATRGSAG